MTDPLDIDCGSPEFNHPGELPGRLTAHRRNEDNTVLRICTTRVAACDSSTDAANW